MCRRSSATPCIYVCCSHDAEARALQSLRAAIEAASPSANAPSSEPSPKKRACKAYVCKRTNQMRALRPSSFLMASKVATPSVNNRLWRYSSPLPRVHPWSRIGNANALLLTPIHNFQPCSIARTRAQVVRADVATNAKRHARRACAPMWLEPRTGPAEDLQMEA